MPDRYVKIVLTVIALELFWIAAQDAGMLLSAQTASAPAAQTQKAPAPAAQAAKPPAPAQPPQPLPVIITGIEIAEPGRGSTDPRAALPIYSARTLTVGVEHPLAVVATGRLTVEADKPLPIRADEPISVRSVPYTPGKTPGE
jgi:hypothetical protein